MRFTTSAAPLFAASLATARGGPLEEVRVTGVATSYGARIPVRVGAEILEGNPCQSPGREYALPPA